MDWYHGKTENTNGDFYLVEKVKYTTPSFDTFLLTFRTRIYITKKFQKLCPSNG